MDHEVALSILEAEAAKLRGRSHAELCFLVDCPLHASVIDSSSVEFELKISAAWVHRRGQALRLFFSIDDIGLPGCFPLMRGALVRPSDIFDGQLS